MKRTLVAAVTVAFVLASTRVGAAAETWTEVKSSHFTAWSNSGDRQARDLLWQFEQIRFAVATLWPWAQVDLAKPLLVLVVKDEQGLRTLAPGFWERRGGTHPASVWVTGVDRHYMAIRADVRGEDNLYLNPYTSSFFSYVGLILGVSFDRDLPLWFSRGLAGVLSNTVLRGNEIYIGAPIPWHIEKLRTEPRWQLKRLLGTTRASPDYSSGEGLRQLDAESWAFVHFLMFGDGGAHRAQLNRFAGLLGTGKSADSAFTGAFGTIEDVQRSYFAYAERALFSFQKLVVDKGVSRERFTSRPLPPAEAAGGRAAFHAAMQRPAEARALIAEARAADPNAGDADAAEALLLEREGKRDEAKALFQKAAQAGSTNAYAHYRAAALAWGTPLLDEAAMKQIEAQLSRAVELNPSFAEAYGVLAEVRAALKQPLAAVAPLLSKAVALDPSDPWIRISAARALWRANSLQEARKVAQVAADLATDDQQARAEAQRLLAAIPATATPAAGPAASVPSPSAPASAPAGSNPNALMAACQANDVAACRDLFPLADKACAAGDKRACLVTAVLQVRGRGVDKDAARASATFEKLCDDNMYEACTQWAVALASDSAKPDLGRARQLLTKSCDGGFVQACEMLKGLPK